MKELKSYLSHVNDPFSKDPMKKDHVLVVIKPGFENLLSTLCDLFKQNVYKIVKTKTKRLLESEAKSLYKVHEKEDFYEDLCKYMSSGLSTAMILYKKSDNIFKDFENSVEDYKIKGNKKTEFINEYNSLAEHFNYNWLRMRIDELKLKRKLYYQIHIICS